MPERERACYSGVVSSLCPYFYPPGPFTFLFYKSHTTKSFARVGPRNKIDTLAHSQTQVTEAGFRGDCLHSV